jgi:hypothetical protein
MKNYKYRNDCVFRQKIDENKANCTFPKNLKNCYWCSTYLPNYGNIEQESKYIDLIIKRNLTNKSLFISILALLLSIITLGLNLIKLILDK